MSSVRHALAEHNLLTWVICPRSLIAKDKHPGFSSQDPLLCRVFSLCFQVYLSAVLPLNIPCVHTFSPKMFHSNAHLCVEWEKMNGKVVFLQCHVARHLSLVVFAARPLLVSLNIRVEAIGSLLASILCPVLVISWNLDKTHRAQCRWQARVYDRTMWGSHKCEAGWGQRRHSRGNTHRLRASNRQGNRLSSLHF